MQATLRFSPALSIVSLTIGVIAISASSLFVANSVEVQRRIQEEVGLIDHRAPTSGDALLRSMAWQWRSVWCVLGINSFSALGGALSAVAILRFSEKRKLAILALCLNLFGLGCGMFVLWGIS